MPIRFIIVRTITNSLILGVIVYLVLAVAPIANQEVAYRWRAFRGVQFTVDEPIVQTAVASNEGTTGYFALDREEVAKPPLKIEPVSPEFGIVIERIGVNAPVVANVDSGSYEEYTEALRSGVAHAEGTSFPGQEGNAYIHGHSSLGFWELGSYATVFTLLNKVEIGDRIVTYYEGERFDYEVATKEIFPGYDITPLVRTYEEAVLSIQTCDPPGTTLNRLVVTARLIS